MSQVLSRVMSYATVFNALIACRPADPWLSEGAVATSGELATRLGLPSAPAIAERIQLERDLALVEQTGVRFLVDQISTEGALEVLGRPRSVIGPQVEQVLDLVGLSDKAGRYPRQLSGGEQQRVSVARAFVNRPPIMLCDEPTGNLDPATSVGIMKLLDRINRTGTTVVMATHDHAIVDAMQRRVVQLANGSVVRDEVSGRYETVLEQ